ncbi:MAG: asparagine synthase (glutamine-hydrolyzing) [Bacteroidales bacterium]|jgi:asparagine synthase (glutamine-hydrolysing)|nr:asparagine synthase (glutamine-hydrolyzing) [Bacteroidales bacterium]
MCGITGFYSKNNNGFASREELDKMTSCLVHRGPDANGLYYIGTVGLGHQRLSILDLSTDANQPMESHSMRYICVYNGEVYNFKQITKELNLEPKTSTDTEIIIEAFAEWGVTFINKLIGMFAISIYDKEKQILYLFRDRMGIKPIYYYWDGTNFAFSSELKSLLNIKYIRDNRKINPHAISEFLHLGYIPEPDTIFSNIHKFPSGNYGIISENGFRTESYWNIEGSIRRNVISDLEEAKDRLRELVESSVSMRLVSDVPFGTFLSGGIDSSLVSAVASKYLSPTPLNTFSIGFEDSKHDESKYARQVASYLGTNHTEYMVTEQDAKEIIVDMLDFYDEPYADSSAIPTMLLSKLAKQKVSMVLSGDGGDELFLGYGSYKWAKRMQRFPGNSASFRKIFGLLLSNAPSNRYKRASYLFKYKDRSKLKSHIFSQEQYLFSENEFTKLLSPEFIFSNDLEQDYRSFIRKLTPEEEQAIFDIRYYLKDDLLVKVDRASMRYALEVRVPLLDHRIVEFALNVDPKLKMHGEVQKYLLKQLLYEYVPEELFNRPKWGFSIPLKKWLYSDLAFLIDEYLNKNIINEFNIVNYTEVKKLITDFRSGKEYLYNRLWLLIILHKFLIKNKNI